LLADDFVEMMKRSLARHLLPASRLEIEVTETVLLDRSIARIGHTLEALRAMGCTLAMDDFGTGYASLSHLTSFPVDRIKIDRSFTSAIGSEGDHGLIARTLIGLGRGLGLEVIAEGVETESQRSFLVAHGCTAVQGYLFARPMLADEALHWLQQHQRRPRRGRLTGVLRGG
jgi:EAL domain-containing protein (putative c-di-GMP-specific phosphodiesterase class I)